MTKLLLSKKHIRFWLAIALSITSFRVFADVKPLEDKNYVVKLFSETPAFTQSFTLSSPGLPEHQSEFSPNVFSNLGASINVIESFLGFGFGIGYGFGIEGDSNLGRGKTKYEDLRFNFSFYDQFLLYTYYGEYVGFYSEPTNGPVDIFPEMRAQNLGASLLYVWSPEKFSIDATFSQTKIQTSSGGSYLLSTSIFYNQFSNNGAVFSSALQTQYGAPATISKTTNQTLVIGGGYGYNWVIGKWMLAGFLVIGFGPEKVFWTDSTGNHDDTHVASETQVEVSIVYNAKHFLFGLQAQGHGTYRDLGNQNLNAASNTNSAKFFIGGKF